MFLDPYFSTSGNEVRISAEQASRFAKEVAGDFNPIHNPENSRFCVPGDLLFSLVLARQGLSQRMCFVFSGMLGDNTAVLCPTEVKDHCTLRDTSGKAYMEVQREGERTTNQALIENFTRHYVAFSGQNFPNILVPLMEQHGVMINPERPLVIYERMSCDLQRLDVPEMQLELTEIEMDVRGKRGESRLHFHVLSGDEVIGKGFKRLLLGGLRPYESNQVEILVNTYEAWKADYRAQLDSA